MSFSASTCLTGLGSATLGPTLSIYSNPISPTNPGVFVNNVATTQVTGNACPYTFVVPDGTTTIRLYDPVSFCYADIPVSNNNICSTCSLNFNSLSNNVLSTINVGNLTGSCDPSITDYRISWYGPNSPTTLAFTSGAGTIWPVRDTTQPITPSSLDAPLLEAGTYVSKITEVEVNGVRFSYTGGTNNVLSPSLLNCSTGTTVAPFNCSNGTYPDTYYKHFKQYITDGASPPKSYSATFQLSANTPSFIWSFSGLSIYDTLKLTFSGSSYTNPIVLENFTLGGDVSTDLQPTTFPKRWQSAGEFKKVTMLTGLTVNNNDIIYINVTPNPQNNATSYSLKFGCYRKPAAIKTCLDSYKDKPYKIDKSTLLNPIVGTCSTSITLSLSGCSTNDNAAFFNSDLATLSTEVNGSNSVNTDNTTKLINRTFSFRPAGDGINANGTFLPSVCTGQTSDSGTINVYKNNVNDMTIFCSNLSDLQGFLTAFNTMRTNIATGYVNDPTNINYYRFFRMRLIQNSGNFLCGDNIIDDYRYFHYSSTAITATTVNGYTMTILTPLIPTTSYTCPSTCTVNCSNPSNFAGYANNLRNTNFNYSNTSRVRYTNPFEYSWNFYTYTTGPELTNNLNLELSLSPKYSTTTYASTSDGQNTLIPSLSATSWDWQNHFTEVNPGSTSPYYRQVVCSYRIVVTTYSPFSFLIYATPVSNFATSGTEIAIPVYDSTNPSAFNPTYVY